MSRMPRVVREGKRSRKSRRLGKPHVVGRDEYEDMELDGRLELIRELVPLGLMHVQEELDREVVSLAGERYRRKAEDVRHYRHGTNPVLPENLIRIAAVDFLTFGCGSWDDDFMAPTGPSDPQWHGSIPRLSIG